MQYEVVFLICAIVLVVVSFIAWVCSRYKKCPSDKIMVVYGSIGNVIMLLIWLNLTNTILLMSGVVNICLNNKT